MEKNPARRKNKGIHQLVMNPNISHTHYSGSGMFLIPRSSAIPG